MQIHSTDVFENVYNYLEGRARDIDEQDPNVYITKLDFNERYLCQLGHLRGQVMNGGFAQWYDNGYWARDMNSLRVMSRSNLQNKGLYDKVKDFYELMDEVHVNLVEIQRVDDCPPDFWDFDDEDDYEESYDDWEYRQENLYEGLHALDDAFYSDKIQNQLTLVVKTLFESLT